MLSRDNRTSLNISAQPGDILRILVENRGRQDGFAGMTYPLLDIKVSEKTFLTTRILRDFMITLPLIGFYFKIGINVV